MSDLRPRLLILKRPAGVSPCKQLPSAPVPRAGRRAEGARRASFWSALGIALGLLFLAPLSATAEGAGKRSLAARLDRSLARAPLANGAVGLYVERASDGSVVYAHGADRLLIPASNQKILTALGALHRFGPTHRFSTRIWAPTQLDVDGVVDELVIEGGGDPAMNSEDWWRLAADLRREGLRGVRGDLRVDDTLFDGPGWHPSWGRVSARAYHAPVGALTANYGTYFVSIWPRARVGEAVVVDVDPPVDYLRVRNLARTESRKARPRLSVGRSAGRSPDGIVDEIVRVEGTARQGDDVDRFPRSVLDPGLYAASLLAYQLEANGIFVEGAARRAPRGTGRFELLLERPGRAVAEAVALCMKYSNNSIAESLVKNLGAWDRASLADQPSQQGGWVAGIRALRTQLEELGVDVRKATLVDGSGLSIQNRLTPRMLVDALRVGQSTFGLGPEFVAAMPIAELDGTLEKRLRGGKGRIRAKTGLLSDASVTALSGFAERADGETLIFSILVNGHSGGSKGAMDAVDALAQTLLEAPLPPRSPVASPASSQSTDQAEQNADAMASGPVAAQAR